MVMLTDRAAFGRERTSMTHPKKAAAPGSWRGGRYSGIGGDLAVGLAALWVSAVRRSAGGFVRSILVDDDEVAISGEGDYQNLHYQGYTYRIDGDVLIVGVRYLRYIPISQTDRFFLCIPVDTPIRSIVVSNGWSEKTVYSA